MVYFKWFDIYHVLLYCQQVYSNWFMLIQILFFSRMVNIMLFVCWTYDGDCVGHNACMPMWWLCM